MHKESSKNPNKVDNWVCELSVWLCLVYTISKYGITFNDKNSKKINCEYYNNNNKKKTINFKILFTIFGV